MRGLEHVAIEIGGSLGAFELFAGLVWLLIQPFEGAKATMRRIDTEKEQNVGQLLKTWAGMGSFLRREYEQICSGF